MKKPDLPKLAKGIRMATSKNAPAILTGIGIAGMITAGVLAVKATPKAMELIKNAEYEKGMSHEVVTLTPVEVVKAAWKPYIPAVATCAVSVACLIGANSVHVRRNAALATAYKLSETALSEYKGKVLETIGEKKEQTIREKVAQERLDKNPVSKSEVIVTDKGDTLCYDYISKRYFKSDLDQIRKAENTINKRMLHDICGSASLNDFYDEIDLERVEYGDELGWNTDNLIDLDIGAGMDDHGKPCIVIAHHVAPKYKYC